MLMASLIALGSTDPSQYVFSTALCTFLVSFCAASQDNVMEAYRVEILSKQERGPGASASVLGFRLGMWVSGGGALYLAAHFNWFVVYILMALCVVVGLLATLMAREPIHTPSTKEKSNSSSFSELIQKAVWPAFNSFFQRGDWLLILTFILFYKVGDTVLNMMSIPFLLEIGFSKIEIAHIAKTFGIFAMIVGGFVGGILLMRINIFKNLVLCNILLIVSCMMFMVQAHYGHHLGLLVLTMGIENLACGMSAAALIAYLSGLCEQPHTATHYAILSSFGSFSRIGLSMGAGWVADQMNWVSFYAVVAAACLPCLLLLAIFGRYFLKSQRVSLALKPKIV